MLKTPLSLFLGALVVLMVVYLVNTYFLVRSIPAYNTASFEVTDDPVVQATYSLAPDDSLPHFRYQQISDSLMRASMVQDPFRTRSGMSFMGVWLLTPFDTAGKQWFIGLPGCRLDHNSEFVVYQGAAHLLYVDWDTAKNRLSQGNWTGSYKSKPIQVGFEKKEGQLLIPIGSTTYTVLKVAGWLLMCMMLVTGLAAFIFYPYRILASIARGDAFNKNNPVYFKRMSLVVVLLTALGVSIPLLVALVFNSAIPPEIDLQIAERFTAQFPMVVLATALWLLGEAFSRGSRLQEFEETTI